MDELGQLFDLERVHKGGAKFDPDKTKWFNQQYLRARPDAELGQALQERLKATGIDVPLERATSAASLLKERATFIDDMLEGTYLLTSGSPLQDNVTGTDELKKRWKPEAAPAIEQYITRLEGLPAFSAGALETAFNEVLQANGLKIGQVMPLYRLFVAGRMQGPGMFDVSALLGRDEVIARLRSGLSLCRTWA
jgi:glutamyl-tRNA synthetase